MVPAPCPLHLRPGGGALPALRPGEPPPPRAGPTATRRCGRQRGRGAARAGRGGETRTLAAPGPEGQRRPRCSKASRLPRSAAAPLRAQPGSHPRVRPPVRPPGRSGLSLSGTCVGHRASKGPHTRAAARREPAPPQPRPRAAPPRVPAPPHLLGPAPHGSQEGPTLFAARDDAGRSDSQHFLQSEVLGVGWCSPSTCFPASKGV